MVKINFEAAEKYLQVLHDLYQELHCEIKQHAKLE